MLFSACTLCAIENCHDCRARLQDEQQRRQFKKKIRFHNVSTSRILQPLGKRLLF